ncbi:hypothetical protein EUTSA_v10029506mg [Eutrema salsugineum]|uniref:FBD domain-containing protein n=1 Tax=Eutrema salsugineum TaxID=72664 RepID=V4MYV4_EUTSA|nr:putative FBD-associated F-box protein At1g05080 [Eutrema salsugineum]ESQ37786.1 hypothetical protein EUTSA_v10029506mg [Eutrema salsugineum]
MLDTADNYDARIEEIEDRISALPEELLVMILLSIPIKEAVATMILSKRWRFMWTMLPKLDYKEYDDESKNSVWWFLDKSLQVHKAPVLTNLFMQLGRWCPSDADVGKWVAKAVDRGLVFLKFELRWSAEPTKLPMTLYSCKSLEILTLSHKVLVDVPSSAWLPSLRVLELNRVVYKNEDSLIRLLSSCPILEVIFVTREKDDNVKKFTVKTPYLLDLWYSNDNISDNDVEDTDSCVAIDTPALTCLDINDNSGNYWSIENTPCLEEVYINVDRSFPNVDKFLRSFSTVLFLELILTENMIVCSSTIKFSRLTKCKIFPCDTNWMGSFVSFLHNAPKLKFLIIDYKATHRPPVTSISWSDSSYDPECLSSSLEKFELIDYGGREEEQELVEYLLTTARCLKTATIYLSTLKLEDEDITMEELKAIQRVSITCQLFFKT